MFIDDALNIAKNRLAHLNKTLEGTRLSTYLPASQGMTSVPTRIGLRDDTERIRELMESPEIKRLRCGQLMTRYTARTVATIDV